MKSRRRLVAAAAALVVLTATLVHDAIEPSLLSHPRPLVVLRRGRGRRGAPGTRRGPFARGRIGAAWLGGALATLVTGLASRTAFPTLARWDRLQPRGCRDRRGRRVLVAGALAHAWTNRAHLRERVWWWENAVIYQVYPRSPRLERGRDRRPAGVVGKLITSRLGVDAVG
jgi:hypothetical protein